jgi:predicted ATPase/class 3 adenylate cyclase
MTATLPTGTVTFLFTDIEGSTQLWEQHAEAMKVALARHDSILREAIETHHGIAFKTVGDAFCAAFTTAPDALAAALIAQQVFHAEAWGDASIKVRMAIHTGAAEARDGDYFGPPLNRVARLLSAGHGGQTLLSSATDELVRDHLPSGASLRDMGERGLKDLVRPEHIYQLLAPGLPAEFPPLKTLDAFRTNLPAQLTSFVGREKEIAAVKKMIASNRLTTLTGPGGAGKTRLSLQVAADLLESFPAGVWFVEFAPLADPALVPQTTATALGLREETSRPLLETLSNYLRVKNVLLILDNCEHLVEAAAQFAEALLQACPNLRLLVSSREALGIPGETPYRVPSLSIPDVHLAQSVETVMQSEAARLFIERALTALPSFSVTKENAPVVAQVCSRLDGIPLAIELAAARVKILKVEQIAQRLDDRFRLLTSGSRTALPRQQTLRALIDWSYDLLSEPERALLRRLSVFAGGWTLEAAETVCQGPSIDDYNVLDPLAQLVNKSLVVVDADDNAETRYRLLETVRQYAREKLSETGEGMSVRDAHLQYFLGLAERAEPELVGPRVVDWIKRLQTELDNIYRALEWSLKRSAQMGLRLTCALFGLWDESGYSHTGYKWLKLLLAQPDAQLPTIIRARALSIQGFFLTFGEFEQNARPILEESLALYRSLENKPGIAFTLLHLGICVFLGDDVMLGRQLVNESLAIYREIGDKVGMASTLKYLGSTIDANDYQKTRAYLNEGLAICREIGNLAGMSRILSDLGDYALKDGDYAIARSWLEESLSIQRQLGMNGWMVYTLIHLGELTARLGDGIHARQYYEESLSVINQAGGNLTDTRWVLVKLGYAAMWQGDITQARNLFEQSLQHFREARETVGIVYTMEGLANLSLLQGKFRCGAQIFGWTDLTRENIDSPRYSVEQADVDRTFATIHTQLDEATFAAAQATGRAMSMDEAITYALESTHD